MVKKILNRFGYYKLNQLKVGGMCGCCGKSILTWVWMDCGDSWDDIGLCSDCQSGDTDIDANMLYDIVTKNKSQ